jgi:hypothetical protein
MIYREYQLNSGAQEQPLDMPAGAEIVSLDRSPENRLRLSVLLDETEVQRQTRLFRCVPSGTKLPDIAGKSLVYLGSVNLLPTLWHVHEVVTLAPATPVAPKPTTAPEVTAPEAPAAEAAKTEAAKTEATKPEAAASEATAAEATASEAKPEVTQEPAAPADAAPAKANPFKSAK